MKTPFIRGLCIACLWVAGATAAQAQISATGPGFVYEQAFDALPGVAGTSTWANDSTLAGWFLFDRNGTAVTQIRAADGGSNTGSFYSFGGGGSVDRALGGLGSGGAYFGSPASGAVAGWLALGITNATGQQLQAFGLHFDGEQWRNGGNASAQSMTFEYGLGSAFGEVTVWQPAGSAFDWTSPVTGTTAAVVDGNVAGLVSGIGGTVALDWAPAQTLWLRWTERNDAGNDHGLAIDNLTFSVSPVPEPGPLSMLLAGVGVIAFVARRRLPR